MAKLDASAIATLLIEIGQRLVLAGENPYKSAGLLAGGAEPSQLEGCAIVLGRLPRTLGVLISPRGVGLLFLR